MVVFCQAEKIYAAMWADGVKRLSHSRFKIRLAPKEKEPAARPPYRRRR
jgi:hypothetical protein